MLHPATKQDVGNVATICVKGVIRVIFLTTTKNLAMLVAKIVKPAHLLIHAHNATVDFSSLQITNVHPAQLIAMYVQTPKLVLFAWLDMQQGTMENAKSAFHIAIIAQQPQHANIAKLDIISTPTTNVQGVMKNVKHVKGKAPTALHVVLLLSWFLGDV